MSSRHARRIQTWATLAAASLAACTPHPRASYERRIARYFGRTHHGAIRGTIITATVMGTGGGPYAVALGFDLAGGDFAPVYLICAVLTIPLGIGAALLRRPEPPLVRDLTPGPDEVDPAGPAQ